MGLLIEANFFIVRILTTTPDLAGKTMAEKKNGPFPRLPWHFVGIMGQIRST
jgi:hypothetical protein